MAKKRITSRPGLFGITYYYENGKYVGKSRPTLWGERKIYFDAAGNHVGTSRPGFFAEKVYHDEKNQRYISSYKGLTGMIHSSNGRLIGKSTPGLFGTHYSTFEEDSEQLEDNDLDEKFFDYDEDFFGFEDDTEYEAAPVKKSSKSAGTYSGKKFAGIFCVLGLLVFIVMTVSALSESSGEITPHVATSIFGCVVYAAGIFFFLIRKPKQ